MLQLTKIIFAIALSVTCLNNAVVARLPPCQKGVTPSRESGGMCLRTITPNGKRAARMSKEQCKENFPGEECEPCNTHYYPSCPPETRPIPTWKHWFGCSVCFRQDGSISAAGFKVKYEDE